MIKDNQQGFISVALKLPPELYTLVRLAALTEKKDGGKNKTNVDVILERLEIGMKVKMPAVPQSLIDSQK